MRFPLALSCALLLPPASSASAQTARPPGLNHLYVVLDAESFAAVRTDRRLAALLGPADGGLPDYAPPPEDTDRLFLRGERTYLETFAPKNRFNEPVGKLGVAIGEDSAAGFEGLADRWRQSCGATFARSTVEWTRSKPAIPWYRAVQCEATANEPALSVWAMAFRPEFARWQTGRTDIHRRNLLAARHGRFDIVALEIAVAPALYDQLAAQLIAAGLRGKRDRFVGSGWTVRLHRAPTTKLLSIDLTLRHSVRAPFALGAIDLMPIAARRVRLSFQKLSPARTKTDRPLKP